MYNQIIRHSTRFQKVKEKHTYARTNPVTFPNISFTSESGLSIDTTGTIPAVSPRRTRVPIPMMMMMTMIIIIILLIAAVLVEGFLLVKYTALLGTLFLHELVVDGTFLPGDLLLLPIETEH